MIIVVGAPTNSLKAHCGFRLLCPLLFSLPGTLFCGFFPRSTCSPMSSSANESRKTLWEFIPQKGQMPFLCTWLAHCKYCYQISEHLTHYFFLFQIFLSESVNWEGTSTVSYSSLSKVPKARHIINWYLENLPISLNLTTLLGHEGPCKWKTLCYQNKENTLS